MTDDLFLDDRSYLLKTKSRKIIPNVARSITLICIENVNLLINRIEIRHQFADLPSFDKMITWHVMHMVKTRRVLDSFIIGETFSFLKQL